VVSAGVNFAPSRSGIDPSQSGIGPSRPGVDLAADLAELKRERNAIILAHNYQVPELQDIADFVGDSLGLSYQAAKTDADIILFCGVHFMAETAKIINPTKRVILPDLDAGCSLSESCPPEALAAFLKKNADKNYYVIAYINCSAGVKAQSDVICTSGNAEKIVKAAPRSEPRRVGYGTDRPQNAFVAGDLLRACRVHGAQYSQDSGRVSRRTGGGASGMHLRGAHACRRSLFNRKDDRVLQKFPSARDHRRYGSGNAAPAEQGNPRQNIHSRPDRALCMRGMSIHENEYAGKSI